MLPSGSEPVRSRSKTNKQDINNTTRYKEIQIVLQNTKYAQSLRLLNNKPKRKGNREEKKKKRKKRAKIKKIKKRVLRKNIKHGTNS